MLGCVQTVVAGWVGLAKVLRVRGTGNQHDEIVFENTAGHYY
jgi:hypothetical protein